MQTIMGPLSEITNLLERNPRPGPLPPVVREARAGPVRGPPVPWGPPQLLLQGHLEWAWRQRELELHKEPLALEDWLELSQSSPTLAGVLGEVGEKVVRSLAPSSTLHNRELVLGVMGKVVSILGELEEEEVELVYADLKLTFYYSRDFFAP